MGRKHKRRKINITSNKEKEFTEYYYPIYRGWSYKTTPIFEDVLSALCFQISRYKRDLLPHHFYQKPKWINRIGSIREYGKKKLSHLEIPFKSEIEKEYFKNIPTYTIPPHHRVSSVMMMINESCFDRCMETMKTLPDYYASSCSIYKPNCHCLKDSDGITHCTISKDNSAVSCKRDNNNMIFVSQSSYNIAMNLPKQNSNCIIGTLEEYTSHEKNDLLVISLGSGAASIEIQSDILTLCLEIDRKAIYTGLMLLKETDKASRSIFAFFDYSKGLTELVHGLKVSLKYKSIRILLSHPNPSLDNINLERLKVLFAAIQTLLHLNMIDDMVVIYDNEEQRKTKNDKTRHVTH